MDNPGKCKVKAYFQHSFEVIFTRNSYRWYITNGQIDRAIEMLKKFAKVNRKQVKPEVYDEFEKSCKSMIEKNQSRNQYTVLDLFRRARLARITIILVIYW